VLKLARNAEVLKVFIGESDKVKGKPLHELIVETARRRGLAGATVYQGILGFGANSRIHTTKVLRLSEDLPLVVEIVDTPSKIARFLPELDAMITEGLVTVEKVKVYAYRHS
jgi:PII-like signaling protein